MKTMDKQIKVYMPQFDRAEKLDYETPKTQEEFQNIINTAPTEILFGFGFRKWSTVNDCIKENLSRKDQPSMISVPAYNLNNAADAIKAALDGTEMPKTSESIVLGLHEDNPDRIYSETLLDTDECIWLFPKEWYDIIPDGFIVTGLSAEQYPFIKGEADNDTRFGCLAYGIRRAIS